nr:CHAT domain-containing protein [Pseudomonas aeruginosa]
MSVTIVDISTKQELVDALNSFYGLIVIFDCHGSHGGEEGFAWLNIGGEKLDVWHLYQQARIPPIVILAACSTHPIEGSHASVANGFIESGVCSVIGTFAPVDSSHAAVFVTRLLERIAVYLPIVLKRREYTWREIITGLLRMSYVRDVMEGLRDRLGLVTQEQYESIHIQANMLINTHEDKLWFEKFRALIAEAARLDQDEIDKLWEEHFQFVESMLYVQLGRPENIVITAE